jgi:hypothetical protein
VTGGNNGRITRTTATSPADWKGKTTMTYIQRKDAHYLETVDEFESIREARAMLNEYRMSDPSADFYISIRACKDWRESKQED